MISHINVGKHISVTPNNPSSVYLNQISGAGMLRYTQINGIEVYDGHTWIPYPRASMDLDLSIDANRAIEWAINKMKEEEKIKSLSIHNQSIRIAYENYKKAEEQLTTTLNLIQ